MYKNPPEIKRNVIIFAFFLAAFGGLKLLPLSKANLERGKTIYPQLTMLELEDGKRNSNSTVLSVMGRKILKSTTSEVGKIRWIEW